MLIVYFIEGSHMLKISFDFNRTTDLGSKENNKVLDTTCSIAQRLLLFMMIKVCATVIIGRDIGLFTLILVLG